MELFDTTSRIAVLENEVKNIAIDVREIRKEQKDQHEAMMNKMSEMENRLVTVERWKWTLLGAAAVIGYILAHVKVERFF
jgi:hypothetical protein